MKISVIGAGAIGSLVAGYLKEKGKNVSLVGHSNSIAAIRKQGLNISGVKGSLNINIDALERLIEPVDLAIIAVKTQDLQEAIKDNLEHIKNSIVLTTQNGLQADAIAAKFIAKENIISSIVMFGSTYVEPGKVVHNFEGAWIIGRPFAGNDDSVNELKDILSKVFSIVVTDDIKGMKYLKVFVNSNNCIPAILGVSMQEAFSNINISRISIAIWKEGLDVVGKSGISLASLPDFPVERIIKLTSMPIDEAAKIFSGIMTNLSKEPLYGSIFQSIKRNRPSEIDYINGEFINIAKEHNLHAPLNEKLVEMVHQVENTKRFFSKEELLNNVRQFIN